MAEGVVPGVGSTCDRRGEMNGGGAADGREDQVGRHDWGVRWGEKLGEGSRRRPL